MNLPSIQNNTQNCSQHKHVFCRKSDVSSYPSISQIRSDTLSSPERKDNNDLRKESIRTKKKRKVQLKPLDGRCMIGSSSDSSVVSFPPISCRSTESSTCSDARSLTDDIQQNDGGDRIMLNSFSEVGKNSHEATGYEAMLLRRKNAAEVLWDDSDEENDVGTDHGDDDASNIIGAENLDSYLYSEALSIDKIDDVEESMLQTSNGTSMFFTNF